MSILARLGRLATTARRLRRCQAGTEVIEFGVVFPAFLMLMVGTLEFAVTLFVGSILESAMAEASRYGITGLTTAGLSRDQQVIQIVSERTYGLIDLDDAEIDTLVYPSFGDIGQPEPYLDANASGGYDTGEAYTDVNENGQWDPDMGAAGLGGPGEVVLYRITYEWGFLTGLLRPLIGSIAQSAAIAVRNEPY